MVSLQAAPASSVSTTKPIEALFSDAQLDAIWRGSWRLTATDDDARMLYDLTLTKLASVSMKEREFLICGMDRQYFIETYCQIYDPDARGWLPFQLWPEQALVLEATIQHKLLVELKARQLGLTWLNLAFGLWEMIFRPVAKVLIFSLKEEESKYLLGDERLRGMYMRLPDWMRPGVALDNELTFELSNGSNAHAFPANAADGRVATFALVDEAERIPNLAKLLRSVQPTIDAGGKMVLLSVSLKSDPQSMFKNIYRGARDGKNDWHNIFLSWRVHPERDDTWYERRSNDFMESEGSLDGLYEQYPATDEEALAPASKDKRLPFEWFKQHGCYRKIEPLTDDDFDKLPEPPPYIPGLRILKLRESGKSYVGGADTAEGLPNSDDSVTVWIDRLTGEQVAVLSGKLTPEMQAGYSVKVSMYFNRAKLMPENNNHGHTFISWMENNGYEGLMLKGQNENKWGWTTNSPGKIELYDELAECIRTENVLVHDETTFTQLTSVVRGTLKAPESEMDDHAMAFALANIARKYFRGDAIPLAQGRANWGDNRQRSRPMR